MWCGCGYETLKRNVFIAQKLSQEKSQVVFKIVFYSIFGFHCAMKELNKIEKKRIQRKLMVCEIKCCSLTKSMHFLDFMSNPASQFFALFLMFTAASVITIGMVLTLSGG